jgi:nucleoside-diphosphate-sugar epimerase
VNWTNQYACKWTNGGLITVDATGTMYFNFFSNPNNIALSIFKTLSNGLQFYTAGANAFVDVRDVVNTMQRLVSTTEAFGQRYLCTGANMAFKQLFDEACVYMNRKSPRFLAGKFSSSLAWRISALLSLFTGKQTVTKDSARSAQAIVRYDSKKLITFLSLEFTNFKETVRHTVEGRLM